MKTRTTFKAFLFIQTFFLFGILNAQVISPTYLGIKDGMSSPRAYDVIQDSYGFLWIATNNGVQKYNGYTFQTFRNHIGDTTSLQNNICYGIMEDSNHTIWVSTDLGVSRYDRKTNLFKNYNFTNPEDRFSGRIQSVFEDSQKVLWATGGHLFGLKQYDEQKDKWIDVNFQYEDNIKTKDFIGWSLGMAEDAQGRLWTSQQYRGLFVRNPGDSIFKHVNKSMNLPVDFAKFENSISNLFVDSRNELWITTETGIYRLNLETEELKTLITYSSEKSSGWLDWNCVREDKNGSIWISNNSHGLLRFDKGSDLVEEIKIDQGSNANKTDWYLSLRNFCIDKSGIFWFGTDGRGIMKYDPVQKPFTAYTFQDSLPGTISGKGITWLYASEQNPSKIYVGLGSFGLDVFDENSKQFTKIPINSENNELHYSVASILETDEGTLLVGTYGDGILELDKNYTRINHYMAEMGSNSLIDNWIRVLKKDKDGKIWIGTRNGLSIWNRRSNTFKNFTIQNSIVSRYSSALLDNVYQKFSVSDTISILKVGDNASLSRSFDVIEKSNYLVSNMGEGIPGIMPDYGWIANAAGDTVWTAISMEKSSWAGGDLKNRLCIDIISLDPGQYTLYYVSDDSHSYGAYNQPAPDNDKWWGIVLAPIDDTSLQNELKEMASQKDSTNFLSNGNIYSIELTDSTAWIGTYFGGINRINLKTDEVTIFQRDPSMKNSLSGDVINDLCFDRDGFLWIATENGLNKFDIKTNTYTIYNQESGLPANQITSIVNGDKNEMWIGTKGGLSRMVSNPSINKVTFINYFTSDGLSSDNFYPRAGLRSKSSTYYIGSDFGLNTFQSISGSQFPPEIVLSNLLFSNETVIGMGENSPVQVALEDLKTLNLSYYENNLSFEYRALEYSNPSKNQYAHKLEGFDKDWIYDNRDFASYTNLEPGDYTLRIRASNAYGVWNEEGKSISIHIASPWWRTWWAYVAYILIFGVAIFMIDRFLSKRIADREREKNRQKELAQAKEIEKAYHNLEVAHADLKSAQNQLVQQEKLASLGQLTAGIAHEIKNPLNFVNNFSEINIEMVDEAMEELAKLPKEKAEPIEELLNDVKANLGKILQHGTRADSIVQAMLQHSRGGTGKMESTDVNALISEFINLAFHGMRASKNAINVKLDFDLDKNMGLVNIIPDDFSRMVLNLANNAFDAMREKTKIDTDYKPVLTVKTFRESEKITVSIGDNGPGIPNEIKDKILQPFFTTKKGTDGTGLGLSITNDIVTAHGGELQVETEAGKGSTFIIQIPNIQ